MTFTYNDILLFLFLLEDNNSLRPHQLSHLKIRKWARAWLSLWEQRNNQLNLFRNFELNERSDLLTFLRMDSAAFWGLLAKVTPIIQKPKHTNEIVHLSQGSDKTKLKRKKSQQIPISFKNSVINRPDFTFRLFENAEKFRRYSPKFFCQIFILFKYACA